MKNEASLPTNDDLLKSWLACLPAEQLAWLVAHHANLTLVFLEWLKQQSDRRLLSEPQIADKISQGMFRIAEQMTQEPLAYPLACWTRGNWLAYHDPQQAIDYYQRALTGYQPTGNQIAILTLLANLLITSAEIDLRQAWEFYQQIETLRSDLPAVHHLLLLRIEQNAGILLRRLGRYQEALATHLRARSIAEAHQQVDRMAEINGNLALTYGSMGQFKECEELLLAARAGAEQVNHQMTAARMEMNLGKLYTVLGRPAEALQRFQVAREKFTRLGNAMEIGSIALREAHLLERIGAWAQAARSYALAQSHFQTLQMWPQVWQATLEGAVARREYGEYRQAATLLDTAAQIWQTQQQALWQSEWLLEKAALALVQDQLAAANALLTSWQTATPSHLQTLGLQARHQLLWAELYEKQWGQTTTGIDQESARIGYQTVLSYAEQQGELRMKRQALVGLGKLTRTTSQQQAKRLLLEAAYQDDLIRIALHAQELKAAFLDQSSDALETLFTWAVADDQPEEALFLSWRAKGSALWELLAAKQLAPTPYEFMQELAKIRERLATLQWQAAVEAQQKNPLPAMLEARTCEAAQLEQQLLEWRRRHYYQTTLADPLTLDKIDKQTLATVVAAMGADLLIEYMRANEQIYALVVNKTGGCRVYHLGEIDQFLDLIDGLTMSVRTLLSPADQQRNQAHFLAECHRLLETGYELLIRPLQLTDSVHRLLIAPCMPLHKIPFTALWDGQHYLVEQQIIELTPTGVLLAAPRPNAPLTQPLAIASSANDALPINLQQAAIIRQHFPTTTTLLDDPNTLGYLHNLTVAPRFVHITAHTLEREEASIFTSLQLANSTLSVEQCYELPLYGSELVTLSSCKTNAGMDSSGSLLAFQSAFFVAGVQRVLSTLWEIHSETTLTWMATFYQKLADGLTPAEALRQTQLVFIANPQLCHPAYWAAFVCSRR